MAVSKAATPKTLGEIAQRFGLNARGPENLRILGVCSLSPGRPDHLAYLADRKHQPHLCTTAAAAVILRAKDLASSGYEGPALVAADPALSFARIATLFDDSLVVVAGRHPRAWADPDADVADTAWIGPNAVVESGASVGHRAFIGPGCIVRSGARIGADTRLEANVYVGARCRLGERVHVQPNAAIGGRGFGLARDENGWVEVPQLGIVIIGNDVEIGSNTTIDRGALDDTIIEDGVKLDNQIQIAHNCRIGAHTAIAACTGIAGSTTIGSRCMLGGASAIGGHLKIADDVVILGWSMVTKSIDKSGLYGSGLPAMPANEWRRMVARIRRLADYERRVGEIESAIAMNAKEDSGE